MASLPTREASRAASDAAEAWRDHRKSCVKCERAARSRRPREMCDRGRKLNADRAAADQTHREEKAKDKIPNPNQGALIELSEIRGRARAH
jgi:hypothetical protein